MLFVMVISGRLSKKMHNGVLEISGHNAKHLSVHAKSLSTMVKK